MDPALFPISLSFHGVLSFVIIDMHIHIIWGVFPFLHIWYHVREPHYIPHTWSPLHIFSMNMAFIFFCLYTSYHPLVHWPTLSCLLLSLVLSAFTLLQSIARLPACPLFTLLYHLHFLTLAGIQPFIYSCNIALSGHDQILTYYLGAYMHFNLSTLYSW